ncbi:hypothetical protein JOY44_18570 [Phormidium sp. CLA17]|uniref:hypothetical protein n=1 Tax=Leptolyngbya sp. Cla-17 TaxID=2803751 RepID=UPI0014915E37|nr:hypothetical protein [Leptolyngbya sp. Cla-17]MBM0743593.1 hypothetical protein [Leptolyngbya sp. Cla-17]
MARYTGIFKISTPVAVFQTLMKETLESCHFDVIYQTDDYLMARETPGNVAFHQLVTTEVLIDKTTATDSEIRLSIVVKNEELPLHLDNHCHQVFSQISQAISESNHWKLIEAVAG